MYMRRNVVAWPFNVEKCLPKYLFHYHSTIKLTLLYNIVVNDTSRQTLEVQTKCAFILNYFLKKMLIEITWLCVCIEEKKQMEIDSQNVKIHISYIGNTLNMHVLAFVVWFLFVFFNIIIIIVRYYRVNFNTYLND